MLSKPALKTTSATALLFIFAEFASAAPAPTINPAQWTIRATHPAKQWTDGYPVGNGSMGALNLGSFPKETIVLNHDTIWSARSKAELKPDDRVADMNQSFELFLKGDVTAGQATYCKAKNRGNHVATYQTLGALEIEHLGVTEPTTDLSNEWKHGEAADAGNVDKQTLAAAYNDSTWAPVKETSQLIGVNKTMVFRRHFTLSSAQLAAATAPDIEFSSADDAAEVFLNGQKIGDSAGWSKDTTLAFPRGLLRAGDNVLAFAVTNRGGTSEYPSKIHLHSAKTITTERRLDLLNGESMTVTTLPDGAIRQTIIASQPDQCVAVRLETTRRDGLHFRLKLNRPAGVTKRSVNGNALRFEGSTGGEGTQFAAETVVLTDSPKSTLVQEGDDLVIKGDKSVTLLVAAATNYNRNDPRQPRADGWQNDARNTLSRLAPGSGQAAAQWTKLRARSADDHAALMSRCALDLGKSDPAVSALPTPERMAAFKKGGHDPELMAQFFQFGRHLLVSSSRPGSLPPNLQGLWEPGLHAAWNGDFHLNINVQMNLWPANATGLSECNEPFFAMLKWLNHYGQATAGSLGCRGYAAGLATDAWGVSDWMSSSPEWDSYILGGHWAQEHLMEHYRFTKDRAFLQTTAWPILKEGALFMLDWMRENPETKQLIAGPGGSPENAFRFKLPDDKGGFYQGSANVFIGNTHDHMIAWEVFSDTLEAAKILGISDDFTKKVQEALKRVPAPPIGSDGRIMEWSKEFGEIWSGHRHKSHLYGLYPGRQITPNGTPELFKAAHASLTTRMAPGGGDAGGGGRTGWNLAWSSNLWARLGEGDQALAMVEEQLRTQVNENFFNRCGGPFQIDGNCGSPAGFAEMLIQSHETGANGESVVRLLPALPKAWPTGAAQGLRARGNLTFDLKWENGAVTSIIAKGQPGTTFTLLQGNARSSIRLPQSGVWRSGVE